MKSGASKGRGFAASPKTHQQPEGRAAAMAPPLTNPTSTVADIEGLKSNLELNVADYEHSTFVSDLDVVQERGGIDESLKGTIINWEKAGTLSTEDSIKLNLYKVLVRFQSKMLQNPADIELNDMNILTEVKTALTEMSPDSASYFSGIKSSSKGQFDENGYFIPNQKTEEQMEQAAFIQCIEDMQLECIQRKCGEGNPSERETIQTIFARAVAPVANFPRNRSVPGKINSTTTTRLAVSNDNVDQDAVEVDGYLETLRSWGIEIEPESFDKEAFRVFNGTREKNIYEKKLKTKGKNKKQTQIAENKKDREALKRLFTQGTPLNGIYKSEIEAYKSKIEENDPEARKPSVLAILRGKQINAVAVDVGVGGDFGNQPPSAHFYPGLQTPSLENPQSKPKSKSKGRFSALFGRRKPNKNVSPTSATPQAKAKPAGGPILDDLLPYKETDLDKIGLHIEQVSDSLKECMTKDHFTTVQTIILAIKEKLDELETAGGHYDDITVLIVDLEDLATKYNSQVSQKGFPDLQIQQIASSSVIVSPQTSSLANANVYPEDAADAEFERYFKTGDANDDLVAAADDDATDDDDDAAEVGPVDDVVHEAPGWSEAAPDNKWIILGSR